MTAYHPHIQAVKANMIARVITPEGLSSSYMGNTAGMERVFAEH